MLYEARFEQRITRKTDKILPCLHESRQIPDKALKNICGVYVAVVVDVEVDHRLRISANPRQRLQHQRAVDKSRTRAFDYGQKDFLEEDFYLGFEMRLETLIRL